MPEIPENYIPMKPKDIKPLREKIWKKNKKKCPVLGKEIPFSDTQLDHQHKTLNEEFSPKKGVIRTCLDFRVNQILGKVENQIKRTGLDKDPEFDLPTFLRNQADYFEAGQYQDEDGNYYIHPKELPKEPNVSKSNYNKLKKIYSQSRKKKKFPEYPKSKKLTKELQSLFKEFNISPYN